MTTDTSRASALARINGAALHTTDDKLAPDELRQRACTELLRQTAQAAGLLDADDAPSADGVISEAAANAIDALLEQNLNVPEPSEEACRRHHAAHQST
jgi:peptidyl-prolyl cis-trans isomerase C